MASAEGLNHLVLQACITERSALRRTPAGVPVLSGVLAHTSKQMENGIERQVALEMQWMAVGDLAYLLEASVPGALVRGTGFLAAKSQRSRMPVLHLTQIEFIEGNENGFQTENQA